MAQTQDQLSVDSPVNPVKEPDGGSDFRRWLIVLVVLATLGAIVATGYYFFFRPSSSVLVEEGALININSGGDQTLAPQPVFTNALSYQVNLAGGRRYLAVDIRLEVIDAQTVAYINSRLPIANDVIIGTLQRKQANDLRSGAGVDELKRDLRRRLNSGKLFGNDFISLKGTAAPIVDVYFDKFILQ